ncbi:MAG: hypothetical protein IJ648_01015 [Lachnospiraceae bacterium]|nr:hypothetical protein [Lachnospiraceae bacterium]
MIRLECDGSYEAHLQEYNEGILRKYGVSSQSAEREIISMADKGNTVALKLYGDMVFYQKILRRHYYRDAFELYMRSAGISVDEDRRWKSSGVAYPLAFWWIGYYLINYRRESFLVKCEPIAVIDSMTVEDRLIYALELAAACLDYEKAPGAINLIGRIFREISENEELFEKVKIQALDILQSHDFIQKEILTAPFDCSTAEGCGEIAEAFFLSAVKEGYVYACNNLAAREADRIVELAQQIRGKQENSEKQVSDESKDNIKEQIIKEQSTKEQNIKEQMETSIRNYIEFLTISADKYEPYAANRLGLFYRTGEIIGTAGSTVCKDHIDSKLAKEYFLKATVYPDANSAWAYLNLMKYYHKDYDTNIELMNEHMEYIKILNAEVYDIAMEL